MAEHLITMFWGLFPFAFGVIVGAWIGIILERRRSTPKV